MLSVEDISTHGVHGLPEDIGGNATCARMRPMVRPLSVDVATLLISTVSTEYFSNLDANFLRLDHLQRPELNKGTVDFAVSREYWAPHPPPRIKPLYQPVLPSLEAGFRQPQPMDFVFVIEMTSEAITSGFAKASCESLLRTLYGGQSDDGTQVEPCFPEQSRLCIMTFDRTLQFYEFSVSTSAFGVPSRIYSGVGAPRSSCHDGRQRY